MKFIIKPNHKSKKFTEKGDFEAYLQSIRVGNTVHATKKGKGSYRRNEKHKIAY